MGVIGLVGCCEGNAEIMLVGVGEQGMHLGLGRSGGIEGSGGGADRLWVFLSSVGPSGDQLYFEHVMLRQV